MPPIQKQGINLNFAQGIDTKSDPWQVTGGSMLELVNSVFDIGGQMKKRNGFEQLPSLNNDANNLCTFKGNAIAIGNNFQMLSESTNEWVAKGSFTEASLSALPLVRTATNQTAPDVAINNSLACAVWQDSNGSTYYQITDAATGQIVVPAVTLPANSAVPRAFALGAYFIVTYILNSSGTFRLQYIAISSLNPDSPLAPVTLSSVVKSATAAYDGVVANNRLYLGFNASDIGGAIRLTAITSGLIQGATVGIAGETADLLTLAADTSGSTPTIYMAYWNTTANNGYMMAFNQNLLTTLSPTLIITSTVVTHITAVATNDLATIFYEVNNTYNYSTTRSDYINTVTCSNVGVVSSTTIIVRSVGLASKAFYLNSVIYMLVAYGGAYQPSYFLIDSSGNIIGRLAYSNGGGYASNQILASAHVASNIVSIGYLFKDLLTSVNKSQNAPSVNGIYSQTGINLANITIGDLPVGTAEIGGSLHTTGGMLWQYDGVIPVEHGFNVWPEDILATWSATGGSIHAEPNGSTNANSYAYQVTYEWTDASGNLNRSAPSVPLFVTTTGAGTAGSITLNIPTLRITRKVAPNPVRIVIYRWSLGQQNYYQVTTVASPIINSTTADSVTFVDTLADSSIVGNALIYTTGGVLENIQAPSAKALTLFKSRLFMIDGEDQNLLWYSKPVIPNVPVEMTDLQTIFISPTTSSQGPTGVNECIFPLDDKLIIFKKNAIYYITGNGPDITGASNDYGDPVFITSTVGCSNQLSIVNMPLGLMFQSDKGIWLLDRNLQTSYIGAPAAAFNNDVALSSVAIPGTNQVRFTLTSGVTLMFDYYYNQWGWFEGIPGTSSTIYEGLHTFINQYNQTFQENVGSYVDGATPVLMRFKSAWFKLAGLQGFQRIYYFYLLGQYYTPHKLQLQIAYDYNANPTQSVLVQPINFNGTYGSDPLYGDGIPYGGEAQVEQWRIFTDKQKCQSFQLTLNEVYDSSLGTAPGAGLTLSGLNLVIGTKKTYPTLIPSLSKS